MNTTTLLFSAVNVLFYYDMEEKKNIYEVFFALDSNKKYFSGLSCNKKMLTAFTETITWLDTWNDVFRIHFERSEYTGDAFTIRFVFSLSAKDFDGYNGVVSRLENIASALRGFSSDLCSKIIINPTIERYPKDFQMVQVEFKCWYDLPF